VRCRLETQLPGEVNQANALVALAVAVRAGAEAQTVANAIRGVDSVAGRYGLFSYHGREVRLLVAKNPAGWAATWSMLSAGRPMVIAVNARQADGRDTSWLWDVDFARLEGRIVVASGDRAADVGVRLSYAGIKHRTMTDPLEAIGSLPAGELDVVGNYTAFHDLYGRLDQLRGRS
jgi:UDP-N-acetylmuramyl tripeptide synthase